MNPVQPSLCNTQPSTIYEWSSAPIEMLSAEMLLSIFNRLEPVQYNNMKLVCHSWHESVIALNGWETRFHIKSLIEELLSFQEKITNAQEDFSGLANLLDGLIAKIELNLECTETTQNIRRFCMYSSHAMYMQQQLTNHVFALLSKEELNFLETLIDEILLASPNSFFKIAQAEFPILYANLMAKDPSNHETDIHPLYHEGIHKLCLNGYFERAISILWDLEPVEIKTSLIHWLLKKPNPQQVSFILQLIIERILSNANHDKPYPLSLEYPISQYLSCLGISHMLFERHLDAILTICEKIRSPFYSLQVLGTLDFKNNSTKLSSKLTTPQINTALRLIINAAKKGENYSLPLQAICASPLSSDQIDIVLSLISKLNVQQDRYQCLGAFGCKLSHYRLTEQQIKNYFAIVATLHITEIQSLYYEFDDESVNESVNEKFRTQLFKQGR